MLSANIETNHVNTHEGNIQQIPKKCQKYDHKYVVAKVPFIKMSYNYSVTF